MGSKWHYKIHCFKENRTKTALRNDTSTAVPVRSEEARAVGGGVAPQAGTQRCAPAAGARWAGRGAPEQLHRRRGRPRPGLSSGPRPSLRSSSRAHPRLWGAARAHRATASPPNGTRIPAGPPPPGDQALSTGQKPPAPKAPAHCMLMSNWCQLMTVS